MANSIFLGPQYSGTAADSPRQIEEKLNADFAAAFAANPTLASSQQTLNIVRGSSRSSPDSVAATQSKINQMLVALSTQGGLTINPITLDPTRAEYGGITPEIANQLSIALGQIGAVQALAALGLSTTAVTRTVAFTANITGATATSTLAASGLPTGLVINSGPRTITGTTSVAAASYPIVITETLAGKWGSPKANNFTLVVT